MEEIADEKIIEKKKIRDQNYELLKIVSMFMIVLWHILMHGNVIKNTEGTLKIVLQFLQVILLVNVNAFVLVTGFYQYKSKFKLSKVFSLNNAAWFYRVAIVLVVFVFGLAKVSDVKLMKALFIFSSDEYWFIRIYLALYLISPFLNKIIENIDKKQHKYLLTVLFILFSILPSISGQSIFDDNRGHSLYHFTFLYFLGAYLNKYPINVKMKKNIYRVILIVIFITMAVSNFGLEMLSQNIITSNNSIVKELGTYLNKMILQDDNPLVIIQTVAFFLFFGTLDLKAKIIGKISSVTFGIYLIHDNSFARGLIYKWLAIDTGSKITSYFAIIDVLKAAAIIFIVCGIIEFIRMQIFKFIYNRKIFKKPREKFYNKLNSIFL